MKVLQFTIPVAHDKSIISQEDRLPHFYPYLHRHAEVQLTWVIEGTGSFVVGTNIYSFGPGDIFYIDANQPHLFKSSADYFSSESEKQVHAITIFFDPQQKLYGLFSLKEMKPVLDFVKAAGAAFKIPAEQQPALSEKMTSLHQAANLNRLIGFLDMLKFLYSIRKLIQPLSTGALDKISESEGVRIGAVYDYIMHHYSTDISLDKVADIAHMTPQAFCRYFKKQTGNTFVSFLNEVRINEACKELISPAFETVSSVAYTTGFNSLTNFNRVFKAVIGKSPLEYLENYRNASN